jgi:hypothetical protein
MHGKEHMYFGDETGRVYRWGVGLTDNGRSIPLEMQTIRYDGDAPDDLKEFHEIYVFTENGESASLSMQIDGKGPWIALQQLNNGTSRVLPRDPELKGQFLRGHDYAIKITQNDPGEPVVYLGTTMRYKVIEEIN